MEKNQYLILISFLTSLFINYNQHRDMSSYL